MHIHMLTQAWGLDLKPKPELVRCKRDGTIEVWKEDCWLNCDYTAFTAYQQRRIRYLCWGSSVEHLIYERLDQVPHLRHGTRFWIIGDSEYNGLWRCVTHREGRIVCHRLLPDYTCDKRKYSIRNEPWNHEADSK
jgi:hypothetical protein